MHRPARAAVLAASVALVAVPAVALAAQPKSDGAYYTTQNKRGESATVTLQSRKIIAVNGGVRLFKNGKLCTPPFAQKAGAFSVQVNVRKAPVSSRGTFSISAKSNAYDSKTFPIKATGTFTSSKRATITISASYKGCKGSFTTKKAVYTQGG